MTSPRGKLFLTIAVIALPVLGIVASLVFRAKPALPELGSLPPFVFVERTGRPFGRDELRGKVWVASFLFTRCQGQCPILTRKLRAIQKELASEEKFRLVSFTVDPENDKVDVLRAYAEREGADAYRWLFLTAEKPKVEDLVTNGFHVTGGLNHSSRFVLVDEASRIRGFYDANDAEAMKRLVVDIRSLL